MDKVREKGVKIIPVLLHVGLGTFRTVQVEDIARHQMHSEYYELSEESANAINEVKMNGGRIIAVGTTSVRTLETAAIPENMVKAGSGWTDKFIYPPYKFKIVDALITNFHLSGSTLFMLTCALAGTENMKDAYKQAVEEQYRFLSYGDAMMIY